MSYTQEQMDLLRSDGGLDADDLEFKYNNAEDTGQHPLFTRWDWIQVVAQRSITDGYWDWMFDQIYEALEKINR